MNVEWFSTLSAKLAVWRRQRREQRWRQRQQQRYFPGPFSLTYFVLLLVGLAVAAGIYWLLFRYLQNAGTNVITSSRIQLAQVALATVAGAGAVAGLYVAYRKQRNDEAGQLREQDRLFTERFSRAADQLGHDSAAVRLAGVYALARIADDSPRDRDTCMRTLAAYLRIPLPVPSADSSGDSEVRRTALDLITERLDPTRPEKFWSAAELDLHGAQLDEINLRGAHIASLTLSDAKLGGRANFNNITFECEADFASVVCYGQASFDETVFAGKANFAGSVFSHAGVSFVKAAFKGARTSFYQAKFEGDADFGETVFCGFVHFQKSIFRGYANFDRADFSVGVEFGETTFDGYSDFSGATFKEYSCFQKARFHGIRTTVTAYDTLGDSADFTGTIFHGNTDFMGADFLDGGLFSNSDFADASLQIEEKSRIIYAPDTKWPRSWPDEFTPPQQWVQRTEGILNRPGPAVIFYTYSEDSLPPGESSPSALVKRDEQLELVRRLVSKNLAVVGIPAESDPEEYQERRRLPSPDAYIVKGPSRSFGDIAHGPHRDSSL